MLFSGFKNMKVAQVIVEPVAIDVVDNLARLRTSNFPMLPLTPASLAAVAKAVGCRLQPLGEPVRLLNTWPRRLCLSIGGDRRDHLIASPAVRPIVSAISLLLVGIKRIAVLPVHLVVPETHLLGYRRAVAITARPANLSTAPFVIRRSVPLHSLVVHKAKSVCRVFPTAAVDLACFHIPRLIFSGKPVNVMDYLGQRIAQVEALEAAA